MKQIFSLLTFFLFYFTGFSQTPITDPHWKVQWADTFKNPAHYTWQLNRSYPPLNYWVKSTSPDSLLWMESIGEDRGGEPQVYDTANVSVVNGTGMILTGKAQSVTCATCTNGGVFSTPITSPTWSNKNGTLTSGGSGLKISQNIVALAVSGSPYGDSLIAATYDAGVFMSTVGGTAWKTKNTGLPTGAGSFPFIYSMVLSGANLFIGTNFGVYLSTYSSGKWGSWTAVNSGISSYTIQSLAISGSYLFAGTKDHGVYLSTNSGTSWTAVNSGISSYTILSLVFSGSALLAGTQGHGVYITTNNGTSWRAKNTSLPTNDTIPSLAVSGTSLFAGTTTSGVYLSTDTGSTWTAYRSGLTNIGGKYYSILSLTINGTDLYGGTGGNGVWKSPISGGSSWNQVSGSWPPISGSTEVVNAIAIYTITGTNYLAAGTPGTEKPNHNYTSGYISTNDYFRKPAYSTHLTPLDHYPEFGYIEANISLPYSYGLFPALWIWNAGAPGTPSSSTGDNSIEVFEMVPGSKVTCPTVAYYNSVLDSTLMTNNLSFSGSPLATCGASGFNPNLITQVHKMSNYKNVHKYGVEWSPTQIIYYIDDVQVRNSPNPRTLPGDSGIFGAKSIIMNLALYDWVSASVNGDDARYKYNFFTDVPKYLTGGDAKYTIENINYYKTTCVNDTNLVISGNLWKSYYNTKVYNTIAVNGSTTNTQPITNLFLRAADNITLSNFSMSSNQTLYIEVSPCK